jgi:hypothetical protein
MHGWKLPGTMDLKTWGKIILNNKNFKIIQKHNSNTLYHIKQKGFTNEVQIRHKKDKTDTNTSLISFIDIRKDNNLGSFIRKIGNQEYTFLNGILILKTSIRKTRFLASIKTSKKMINKFLTLDIETRDIKNKKNTLLHLLI